MSIGVLRRNEIFQQSWPFSIQPVETSHRRHYRKTFGEFRNGVQIIGNNYIICDIGACSPLGRNIARNLGAFHFTTENFLSQLKREEADLVANIATKRTNLMHIIHGSDENS